MAIRTPIFITVLMLSGSMRAVATVPSAAGTEALSTLTPNVVGASSGSSKVAPAFTVYYYFGFNGQPPDSYFEGLGMHKYQLTFESSVTSGNPKAIDESRIRAAARKMLSAKPYKGIIGYDIEFLDTDFKHSDLATVHARALTLAKAVGWAKHEEPTAMVGMYGQTPVQKPWINDGRGETLAEWRHGNDVLQPLADALDYLSPVCYLYYDESTLPYGHYAPTIIREAIRLAHGKPVYAYVSPQYHGSTKMNGQAATHDVWKNVLTTVRQSGADGMIIFAGERYMGNNPPGWNNAQNRGWQQALVDFMATASR